MPRKPVIRETVSLYEAKTNLSRLVDRAAAGEEIVISKSGRPRARLVPLEDTRSLRCPARERASGGCGGSTRPCRRTSSEGLRRRPVNLLLDTHVLIWWDEGRRLTPAARRAIEMADAVYVSAASAWEIAIKTGLGLLRPSRSIEQAAGESGFVELPIGFRHAERVRTLPPHHRDPFDRMLVAQAAVEELTLVTRDPMFARYPVELIQA